MESESKRYLDEEFRKVMQDMIKMNAESERRREEYRERQEKIKNFIYNLKFKIFKIKKIDPRLVALIGTSTLVFGSALYVKSNEKEIDTRRTIKSLEIEIGIHGGVKNMVDDQYIYNLTEHLESGKCKIPDTNMAIESRISEYCKENNIPKYIEVAAIEKFNYYMTNDFEDGNKIDLVAIYNNYSKNPEANNIKLKNGDIITIDGNNVTYTSCQNESNELSR